MTNQTNNEINTNDNNTLPEVKNTLVETHQATRINTPVWDNVGKVINIDHMPNATEDETVSEVLNQTELNWHVASAMPEFQSPNTIDEDGNPVMIQVPANRVIFRTDTERPLGMVGTQYATHQNRAAMEFIEQTRRAVNGRYEFGGMLRGGETTFTMISLGEDFIVDGDKVDNFILFRNSHNGKTPFQAIFLHHRIACYNALVAAFKRNKDRFNISHTASMPGRLADMQKLMKQSHENHGAFIDLMRATATKQISMREMKQIIETEVFPAKGKIITQHDEEQKKKNAVETIRQNNINKMIELIEDGEGTEIPGVRGTVWGFYNSLTEFADHNRRGRVTKGSNEFELRMEGSLFTAGARFKQDAFDLARRLVA